MKKITLAALVASVALISTAAQADSTVRTQPKAAPTPATAAAVSAPVATPVSAYHTPYAEFEAMPGNKRSIFQLDFMIPVYQMLDRMLFVDLRGMLDTKQAKEGNLGLGYRHIVNNAVVLGVYGYGDLRRTKAHNNFTGGTIGVEALSNFVDGRVNVYLTGKSKKRTKDGYAHLSGTTIQAFGSYEQAMNGFDGEVGLRIPTPGVNNFEARVFAGGYHFSRSGAQKVAGPRGRFEVRLLDIINPGSRLTLGVEVSHDKVRKTNVFGHIGLRIPMNWSASGGKAPQGLQSRLMDKVIRDVDIVTSPRTEQLKDVVFSKDGTKAIVIDSKLATTPSGADGSIEKPFGKDKLTGDLSAYNTVVVLKDGDIPVAATLTTGSSLLILGSGGNDHMLLGSDGKRYTVDNLPKTVKGPSILVADGVSLVSAKAAGGTSVDSSGVNYKGVFYPGGGNNAFTDASAGDINVVTGISLSDCMVKGPGVAGALGSALINAESSKATVVVRTNNVTAETLNNYAVAATHSHDDGVVTISSTNMTAKDKFTGPLFVMKVGSAGTAGTSKLAVVGGTYVGADDATAKIAEVRNVTGAGANVIETSYSSISKAQNIGLEKHDRLQYADTMTVTAAAAEGDTGASTLVPYANESAKITIKKVEIKDSTATGIKVVDIRSESAAPLAPAGVVGSTTQKSIIEINAVGNTFTTSDTAGSSSGVFNLEAPSLPASPSTVTLNYQDNTFVGKANTVGGMIFLYGHDTTNVVDSLKVNSLGGNKNQSDVALVGSNSGGAADGVVAITYNVSSDETTGAGRVLALTGALQLDQHISVNGTTLGAAATEGNTVAPAKYNLGASGTLAGAYGYFDWSTPSGIKALTKIFGDAKSSKLFGSKTAAANRIDYYA